MQITIRGLKALQQLRIDLQESAGLEFTQGAHLRELLLLYDVCKYLELSTFQARDILGVQGYKLVTEYINQPITIDVPSFEHILQ